MSDVNLNNVDVLAQYSHSESRTAGVGLTHKEPVVELIYEDNLHLVIETGAVIRPARNRNDYVMFMIPTGVKNVRIVSNTSHFSDVTRPCVDDRCHFGVAIGDITMFEGGRSYAITSHLTDKELNGWNTLEWKDVRWTSGNAWLPLGERHHNSVALLAIQIKKAYPYFSADAFPEKAALRN